MACYDKGDLKAIRNIIKNLDIEVKGGISAFQSKVIELAATMKVIILVVGKSPLKGGASEHKGEVKVLKPRPNAG